MIDIERYKSSLYGDWDRFVKESRNGTFLHLRGYMDYHSDRFEDCSVIAKNKKGSILAVLPANRRESTLYSHQGLTYGGWLLSPDTNIVTMMEIWSAMNDFLNESGIDSMVYKPVPHIYHKYPCEEDLYVMWRNGGKLEVVQSSTVIDLRKPYKFDMTARRKVRKTSQLGVEYHECVNWKAYWALLESCLSERHSTRPVHTLDEILLLRERFPENIKLYTAQMDHEMLAGVVMYLTDTTAHCQYIASTIQGRELNILPGLFDYLIETYRKDKLYFDFGTSNEDAGRYLNEGLSLQKNSFGGRTVVFSTYHIEL